MMNTSELEARAKAAAEALANRQEHQMELQGGIRRLELEIEELKDNNQRLETDFASASIEKVRLADESQRLANEAKALGEEKQRLIGDNKRVQEEVERLESEAKGLRKDCERLNVLLEALIVQIELNVEGDAGTGAGETTVSEVANIGAAEPASMTDAVNDDEHQAGDVVSAMRDKYAKDEIEDVPNDRARRLLGSIKERL